MANHSTLLGIYYIMYNICIYALPINFWQKIRSSIYYFNVAKISTEFILKQSKTKHIYGEKIN